MHAALVLLMVVFTQVPGVGSASTGPQSGVSVDVASLVIEARGECPSGPAVTAALLPVLGAASVPRERRTAGIGSGGPLRGLGSGSDRPLPRRGPRLCRAGPGGGRVHRAGAESAHVPVGRGATAVSPGAQAGAVPVVPARSRRASRRRNNGQLASPDSDGVGGRVARRGWVRAVRRGFDGRGAPAVGRSVQPIQPHHRGPPAAVSVQRGFAVPERPALAPPAGRRAGGVAGARHFSGRGSSDDQLRAAPGRGVAGGDQPAPTAPDASFRSFCGMDAEYFPKPYQLDVDPIGTVGSSSRFWLGATAGVLFESL